MLQEANNQILLFQQSKEAWDISMQLIQCTEIELAFIGSKALLRKLETSFSDIPSESINAISEFILNNIVKFANGI